MIFSFENEAKLFSFDKNLKGDMAKFSSNVVLGKGLFVAGLVDRSTNGIFLSFSTGKLFGVFVLLQFVVKEYKPSFSSLNRVSKINVFAL